MRREFPRSVRDEIIERSKNERGQICCEGCSLVLGAKPYEIDHVIAEGLVVDKSAKLTAKDGQLLGKGCCHRGKDGKTARDVKAIAKAKRVRRNHNGDRRQPSRPMMGSRASGWKKSFNGPPERRC